jgi:hypothetical protein
VSIIEGTIKKLDAHIWEREANEHYVEPEWCSRRLFQEEKMLGGVWDPACGFGNIVKSARAENINWYGTDLIKRSEYCISVIDFLSDWEALYTPPFHNIVTNPPFNIAAQFALRAIEYSCGKTAIVFPTARLNAAHWLKGTPLRRVWMMTPRPSMPPGHVITDGGKITGGKMDYCWLVWEAGYEGEAEIKWLRRDGAVPNGERT